MSSSDRRVSGFILMVGAVLITASIVMSSSRPIVNQRLTSTESLLLFFGATAFLCSLPALYSAHSAAAGSLGFFGFLSLQAGVVFFVATAAPPIFFPPFNEPPGQTPAALLLGTAFIVGLGATATSVLQAKILPRPTGLLMWATTAALLYEFFIAEFLPPVAGQVGAAVFGVLTGITFGWIGWWLVSASYPPDDAA